ncbi:hypothetical protein EW146_g6355 [Bondarzewia mesenterica]|uniref:Nucleoporin NSP1-like C-terminal domain-containing protein n=1 Tax=Bondarzewia mesenterica TaxID=1095465 RepID=A0A4S4LUH9_9AGAM|nr:hypothetical protein EW146_g6355 [Bondarzewia mesenterica]
MSFFGQNNNNNGNAPGAQQTPSAFSNLTTNTQVGSAFGGGANLFGGQQAKPASDPPPGGNLFAVTANKDTNSSSGSGNTGGGLFSTAGSGTNPLTSGGASGTNQLMGGGASGTHLPMGGGASSTNPLMSGGASGTNPPMGGTSTGSGLFSGGSTGTNPLLGGSNAGTAHLLKSRTPILNTGLSASTGGSTNAFGGLFGSKPADQTAAKTTPAPSNFFSAPPASATPGQTGTYSTGPITSLPGGSLFPKKPDGPAPTPASAPSPSAITPASTSLGAFSLPGTTPKISTPATGTGLTGGLFGNLGAAKDKPEEKKDGAAREPLREFVLSVAAAYDQSSLAASAFGILGAAGSTAPTPAEKKDAVPSPFGSFGVRLGVGDKDKAATPAAATLTTGINAPAAISVPPPSMLRGKSIEEIVNRWSTDLENHVREFTKFSAEVAVWDRALIENGNNVRSLVSACLSIHIGILTEAIESRQLAALYNHVLAAEREQNDIDQSLDHIEQQQKELSATLEIYEKQTEDILGGQGGNLRTLDTGPADTERDKKVYMLATELHSHLDDLSSSLTQLVESVNAVSLDGTPDGSTPSSGENSMSQIAQVLSNHLESLQWIDGASRELEGKVVEVEKRVREAGLSVNTSNSGPGGGRRGYGLTR